MQANSTMEAWMAEYPLLFPQFQKSIQDMKYAGSLAAEQLSHILASNLSDAEQAVYKSQGAEADRIRKLLEKASAEDEVNGLLAVANHSLTDLDETAAHFRKVFVQNMIAQATRTQKAAIQVTDAIRSRSEKNAAQEQLLFTNEGQSLVRATELLDTVADQVGVALNTSNASTLASQISASVQNLENAQINLHIVDSSQADIQAAGMNATLTAMSLSDAITGANTKSSLLKSGLLTSNMDEFATGLNVTSSALDVTGDSVAAINEATVSLIGAYAVQAASADADRAEKADAAAAITEISAAALGALIELFLAQNLGSAEIANSSQALVAEQRASISALIAIFATTVDAAVNVSTAGYASLTAQELALANYLEAATKTVVDREFNTTQNQSEITETATKDVESFDLVNLKVIEALKTSHLEALESEQGLETMVSDDFKEFENSRESLEVKDSGEASSIVQNLSAWLANMRQAVASDLKSLAG